MKIKLLIIILAMIEFFFKSSNASPIKYVTIPFVLDHNRMLVEVEIQRNDGTWRKAKLWIDTGYPIFSLSESLAADLGIDVSKGKEPDFKRYMIEVPTPRGLKIGGMNVNIDSIPAIVNYKPHWLFGSLHHDGNLPSSILKNYHIVFDYPKQQLTIAEPNTIKPKGTKSVAYIHPETGIVSIDGIIDGDTLGFALDIGASYSFISEEVLNKYSKKHPEWPSIIGTAGCANMWGWFPANEQNFSVVRISKVKWGNEFFNNLCLVGTGKFLQQGISFGEWYSRKTAKPVVGFIGPNALKTYRIEIDFKNSYVYFDKINKKEEKDMDLVGISIRELPDSSYQVLGIVKKEGKPILEGIEPEDIIISIDGFTIKGNTMGVVVDKLRGNPGVIKKMVLKRNGQEIKVDVKVEHLL